MRGLSLIRGLAMEGLRVARINKAVVETCGHCVAVTVLAAR
jgi:hypothetical protein